MRAMVCLFTCPAEAYGSQLMYLAASSSMIMIEDEIETEVVHPQHKGKKRAVVLNSDEEGPRDTVPKRKKGMYDFVTSHSNV